MRALAAWAGIIVRDLDVSAAWYRDVLPVQDIEQGDGWVAFNLVGGSCVELHAGDPDKPGLVFPSYGADPGPAVMPGLSVPDPVATSVSLDVMRVFPDWMVVAAGDGLRIVLTDRCVEPGQGLVGFAFTSPDPDALAALLAHVGFDAVVEPGARHQVVPLVAARSDGDLVDPDGTLLRLASPPVPA